MLHLILVLQTNSEIFLYFSELMSLQACHLSWVVTRTCCNLSSHPCWALIPMGVTHPLAPVLGCDSCFLPPSGDQDALLGLICGEKRVHLRALPLLLLCCGSPCNVACNFLTYQPTQMSQCEDLIVFKLSVKSFNFSFTLEHSQTEFLEGATNHICLQSCKSNFF